MSEAPVELLRFQSVSKSYVTENFRSVTALEDLAFTLTEREFISVIGPSGCGKSTMLRLAAGLDQPSAGEVLLRGNRISGPDRRRGFVFQTYNAFPWLTVRKNIEFGLDGADAALKAGEVTKWLSFTGLTEFADSYPKALSGGMLQRLALARAMIVQPEILLLDEPFGALDERIRENMQALLLKAVADSGCSVVFVTHDIREAILLGDRVILLSARPGRIIGDFVSPLSKPRNREHLKSPELNSLYGEILDSFPT